MVGRFPGGIHTIMAGRTGQPVVGAAHIQRRMVEACGKAAAGLMAMLALIRRRRVSCALADRLRCVAIGVATYTLLGLDGRILVIDRIGLHEIARRGVTRIAIPAVRIDGGMHGIRGMSPGIIGRIVVGTVVTSAATRGVGGMDRIHKWACRAISAGSCTADARAVVGIRMTDTAIR